MLITITICFTICLFISLDSDGHRAPQSPHVCLFISPDLDGHRAPDMFTICSFNTPNEAF